MKCVLDGRFVELLLARCKFHHLYITGCLLEVLNGMNAYVVNNINAFSRFPLVGDVLSLL